MNQSVKKILMLCLFASLGTQIIAREATDQNSSWFTSVILAPLTFANFCYSSFVSVKRDKTAKDLVTNRCQIDEYAITVTALKKNKRTLLRAKTKYEATFSGMNHKNVVSTCIEAIEKLSPDLLLIAKPAITTDTEIKYSLKAFTTSTAHLKALQQDLLDVFYIPEDETLTYPKKVAVSIAPLGLVGVIVLLALL